MRLIDGEALYKSLADLYKERGFNDREIHFSLKDMEMNINGAPAVDVVLNFTGVDVVRCKDCKKYIPCQKLPIGTSKWCDMFDRATCEMNYCGWGERREDERTVAYYGDNKLYEWQEPEINPCRGCVDYDGRGGCKSNGGCGAKMDEVAT